MSIDPRENITALIKLDGRSQRQICDDAGIDQPTLSKYLARKTADMTALNMAALARALGVTTSELLGEVPWVKDRKIANVVTAMQQMPEYKKDAVVAASSALAKPSDPNPDSNGDDNGGGNHDRGKAA